MGDAPSRKNSAVRVLPFRTGTGMGTGVADEHAPQDAAPASAAAPVAMPELKRLYRAHWQELCRYVNHTFGAGPPEPEDVVQLAFTRYAALEHPERVENPRAFLFVTVRNIVLDHRRSQDRAERYVRDALAQAGATPLEEISPERALMERQRFELLGAAIRRLPVKQQQVLAMNRFHGMTYEEISSRTGWSLADISRQVTRAIAALDAALKEMESI